MSCPKFLFLSVLFLLIATPAYADVIWPGLILEQHLLSIRPIIAGLIAEYFFLRYFFKMGIRRAVFADLAMNTASFCLGMLLIPLAGIAWAYFPGLMLVNLLGMRGPVEWIATFLMATFINAGVESLVIRDAFKTKVGKKGFAVLSVANAISVGIAMLKIPNSV